MSRKSPDVWVALAWFAVGLIARLLIVGHYGFDGLYGQDPFAYYDFALALHQGQTPGPLFWPLGYPLLLTAGFALFSASAWIGQAINLMLGASLAPLAYALARQVGAGRPGALVAALVMTICGQAMQSSLVIMADIPALFWAVVSAVALLTYVRGGEKKLNHEDAKDTKVDYRLALAALTLALAAITRWLYLILALPWGVAVLLAWRGWVRWRDGLLAGAMALLILVPQLLYSSASPFPTLNHAWVQGWSPQNAFRRDFVNVDGQFHYEKINALFYAAPFYDAYYLAPLFTPFLLIGLWALWWRRLFAHAALLTGWALLPYLFLTGIPYQNVRFSLIVFPSVAVLVGIGADALLKWFRDRARMGHWRYAAWATLAVVILIGVGQTVSASWGVIDTFISNQQRDRAAAAWVAAQIPPGATLYTFGLTLTLQHDTDLEVYELYFETPETLAERWRRGQADYLLLNVWVIETQWAGREPQIAYHWLRDARGLTELGRHGNYTLFRVEG